MIHCINQGDGSSSPSSKTSWLMLVSRLCLIWLQNRSPGTPESSKRFIFQNSKHGNFGVTGLRGSQTGLTPWLVPYGWYPHACYPYGHCRSLALVCHGQPRTGPRGERPRSPRCHCPAPLLCCGTQRPGAAPAEGSQVGRGREVWGLICGTC